ncbi:alpha/beta hydrolase [Nocardia sp. NPDC020380]|uniref:alpha/beta hydrolase n=1 Tax=Nocardia sp. NPDC020380 TaxID=3364309 RepID=UPI0037919F00
MRELRRRTLLAACAALGAAATLRTPAHAQVPGRSGISSAATGSDPIIRTERVYSAARGREIDMVAILPPGVPTDRLPISLLLHGRHGTAHTASVGGLGAALATAVAAKTLPAFGFVALDGGDNYWHEQPSGDDPMRMLLTEVPGWLSARRLGGRDGTPFACAGTSMGGFGALLYTRRRHERGRPLRAVATLSPALMTEWPEMNKRRAFRDAEEWAALDPLRNIGKLGHAPTGVWVGDRDRFAEGCRRFMATKRVDVGSVTPGGHTEEYWRTVTPDVIRFLGHNVG